MELLIGKGNNLVKRHPGYEMPRHPDGGLAGRSWFGWLLGLVPLGLLGWAGWLGVPGLGPWYPQPRQNFVFPRSFISNSFSKYFVVLVSSSGVPIRFRLSTYTIIVANLISDFLTKMHGHIGLFAYPSFNKYSLRQLYHKRLDCFNPYKDRCNLLEHILQGFVLFASSNLNL